MIQPYINTVAFWLLTASTGYLIKREHDKIKQKEKAPICLAIQEIFHDVITPYLNFETDKDLLNFGMVSRSFYAHVKADLISRKEFYDSQMAALRSADARLHMLHFVETGKAAQFWNRSKQRPSATWLGDYVDRFFGWGQYYKTDAEVINNNQ
jgi:hypothetical protein